MCYLIMEDKCLIKCNILCKNDNCKDKCKDKCGIKAIPSYYGPSNK